MKQIFKTLFRLSILVTTLACGRKDQNDVQVVGGSVVSDDSVHSRRIMQSTVSLMRGRSSFCSGTVIAKGVVLSAAHCFRGLSSGVSVSFGTYSGQAQARVRRIEVHPNFDGRMEAILEQNFDIALVFFDSTQTPQSIVPAQLAPRTMRPHFGTIVGFGLSNTARGTYESIGLGTMRKKQMQVAHALNQEILLNGAGACPGDSGGPLYFENGDQLFLAGVASRIRLHTNSQRYLCENSSGAIYTDARSHLGWIKDVSKRIADVEPFAASDNPETTSPQPQVKSECEDVFNATTRGALAGIGLRSLKGTFIAKPASGISAKFCFKVVISESGKALFNSHVLESTNVQAYDDTDVGLEVQSAVCSNNVPCAVLRSEDNQIKFLFVYNSNESLYKFIQFEYFGAQIRAIDIAGVERISDKVAAMH